MSDVVSAEEVMIFLNLLFNKFDQLFAEHQMQKVG